MDNISRLSRLKVMRSITGDALRPELFLKAALRRAGAPAFLENSRAIEGKPDVAFPRHRMAVFVDGCFFHGCPWHYRAPSCPRWHFWREKLHRNIERDYRVNRILVAQGWGVIRVWECWVHTQSWAAGTAEWIKGMVDIEGRYKDNERSGWVGRIPFKATPVLSPSEIKVWKQSRKTSSTRRPC